MALSIKTSIATPTANSYVSVASADDYFESRTNAGQWNDIDTSTSNTTTTREQKEGLLIQSTREIDNIYRYFGEKFNQGIEGQSTFQNLEFPRESHTDDQGDPLIKEDITFATYEQALWVLERRSKRRTEEGATVELDLISRESFMYLKLFIDRSVRRVNQYPFQRSAF